MNKLGFGSLVVLAMGCSSDGLNSQDALYLMEQVKSTAQASMLVAEGIELGAHFTIGSSPEVAAADIGKFYASEIGCAEVTVAGNVVNISYGALRVCKYQEETYIGDHSIKVVSNKKSDVRLRHSWQEFKNSKLAISGEAVVTFDGSLARRHVELDLDWTRQEILETSHSSGSYAEERFGTPPTGVTWSGTQSIGTAPLTAKGTAMRWRDPVPQSGEYEFTLTTGVLATTSFTRLAEADIRVKVSSDGDDFFFDVITTEGAGGSGGGGSGGDAGGQAGQAGQAGQDG